MSVASLSSPVTLVIPSLWVNAGIFLCFSVLFSIVGLWPRKKPLFLVYGVLCMLIAGFQASQAVIYSMTTVPEILPALRSRISFAVLALPLFYAFVCLYTQNPFKQRWMWSIGLVSLGFLLLNLLSPYTIRYAEITQIMPVRLRWGETVNVEMGRPSAWTHLYLTTWIFAFLWAIRRSLVFYRAGRSWDAVFFGAQFLIQLAAILFDVAHSYMQAPHVVLTPYVLTSMAALMGARLVGSLRKSLDDAEESEHRLRENEQRLSLTLEATSSGLWDWNIQTGDVYFDERWVKSLGYSREEVVPHLSFWEGIIHPEDLPRVRSAWQDHVEGRSPIYECDNRLRTRSGTFRHNLDRGKIVEWDADGRPLRMVGTDTDITERKRMEEQLRLTQFAIDHAADAIFIADTNKRFVYVNNEACRSLEYTRDELMELTVAEITPTYEPEKFRKQFHILKETGVVRYETVHRTKSGRDFPIDLTINLFERNDTILMCGVARDITERKRAVEALRVSEERLRATIDNTPHVAVQWYDKHGRVLYWNRASEMIFGWKSEEVLGKTLDQLIHTPEEAAAYVKLLEEIYTTRRSVGPAEYGFRRRDGTSGVCLSTTFAIPSPDGEPCFVCMDVDVTERNRAEEQVQHAYQQLRELTQQLEATQEAERKRIARELHDEFGQLITALRVDLSWLSRKPGAQANDASGEEVAQRLKSMTELVDLLARSTRRIAGSLRPSILDDLGLVAALRWQTRDFQERTGLECTLLLGPDVAQMQVQDSQATALFRIAQELLTNVIRHANAQRVQISLQEERGALVMTIDDDGRGITEQDITKPTSFGLRGIRERVALIGGELTMKGVPHRGTTVGVRVPILQQR